MSTVHKATELLFCLNGQARPRGVSELSRALGTPKASTYRLLQALCHRNLVRKDANGRYQLGVGLIALGHSASARNSLTQAARPVMSRWARELDETLYLVSAHAGTLLVLDKVEGSGLLRVSPQVGTTVPIHATAVGHLYRSLCPEQIQLQAGILRAYTPKTPVAPTALERIATRVRAEGVATSEEEWRESLSAVAAPIQVEGHLLAALVIGVVAPALAEEKKQCLKTQAMQAANAIAKELVSSS